ncbi:MAG: class Ib ribonucleoside-diphosphate reductase assembly flavoprotein NrdI [Alphaproteobacteria bacterium]|jgi:protein involved in ribonucleotide reduction|nr:class Ib ribonucleoside-diphosphate reductase assembly flavoprotein NrdI [Alphaproteobacteria bacterium]
MQIIYASKTGNIPKFLAKAGVENALKIGDMSEIVNEDFILITYTTGIGEVPSEVAAFLKNNHQHLIGVIGSGNKNWGNAFCNGAKTISKTYNSPLLLTFELAGNKHDVEKFLQILANFTI